MARFRWSTALTLTLGLLAAAGTTSTATVPQPKFFRWDPLVVRKTETKPVRFEFAVDGDPTRVVFELNANAATAGQPGVDYAMHDDGTAGDLVAGDGIYTISFPAQTLVSGLSADDVFRHFVGYVKLFQGATQVLKGNMFVSVLTDEIPRVDAAQLAADVQTTSYIVNVLDPVFWESHDPYRATRRFYEFFGDDFDMVNIVSLPSRFLNRSGGPIKSDVQGIGARFSDNTAWAGSAGRLIHLSSFPLGADFDGADFAFSHEIGHQWINNLPEPTLQKGSPHWPIGSTATGIMGYGTSQGLEFPCVMTEERNGIRLRPRPTLPAFTDLDLYVMGFIPPEQVAPQLIFADQSEAASIFCTGQLYTGPMTRVSIDEVIAAAGERIPRAGDAPTHFKVATIASLRIDCSMPMRSRSSTTSRSGWS